MQAQGVQTVVVPASQHRRVDAAQTPRRSPEWNPVENVWQFLRDNWLSNRVFRGYDDIVAHCCDAWSELMGQPWRIKSIGRREWAHGF